VTTPEEAEKLIIKGWQFVAVLPNDKVIIKQGSTQNVGGPDRSRVVTCLKKSSSLERLGTQFGLILDPKYFEII